MKVLVLSQYYPPENTLIAPTLARELANQGHRVRVLTGYPNYPEGRLFDGYSQQWRHREADGAVEVLRVPMWLDHSQSPVRRAVNYASFGLASATARSFAKGADVIYVYATQMTAAFGPWLWSLVGGTPYVLHVQDLWPDSITGSSLVGERASKAIDGLLAPWLSSVYQRASAVIGIAPTMVDVLVERGVDRKKTHLVYNWAREDSLPSGVRASGATRGRTRVLYAGNVGDLQALDVAVRAAHDARDSGVDLTILGDGVALPRVKALADELQAPNVSFSGRVPRARMSAYYDEADFALVSLRDLPAFRGTIPSKLQAALSHGVPVVSTVQGDVRRVVEEEAVGFTAEAEDVSSLAAAFRAAGAESHSRAGMAARARDLYSRRFSQTAGITSISEILQIAAGTRRPVHNPSQQEEPNAVA